MTAAWYELGGANQDIFHVLNGMNYGPWYDKLMLLGTELGSHLHFVQYLAAIMLCMTISVARNGDMMIAKDLMWRWLSVVAVLPLAYAIEGWWIPALKDHFNFLRPYASLPAGTFRTIGAALADDEMHKSFPSGHTSFAMLMAAGLWPVLKPTGKLLAALYVAWVGWSRIALGAHFPTDVLAGCVLSLLTVIVARALVLGIGRYIEKSNRPVNRRVDY